MFQSYSGNRHAPNRNKGSLEYYIYKIGASNHFIWNVTNKTAGKFCIDDLTVSTPLRAWLDDEYRAGMV